MEQWHETARRVLPVAYRESSRLGCDHIGTSHLLLALIQDDGGPTTSLLEGHGLTADALRSELRSRTQAPASEGRHRPFTPSCRSVFALAAEEAHEADGGLVGSKHLWLGLIRETRGSARRILVAAGVDPDALRELLTTPTVASNGAADAGSDEDGVATGDVGDVEDAAQRAAAAIGRLVPDHRLDALAIAQRLILRDLLDAGGV